MKGKKQNFQSEYINIEPIKTEMDIENRSLMHLHWEKMLN